MHFCVQLWMVFHALLCSRELLGLPIPIESEILPDENVNQKIISADKRFEKVLPPRSVIEGDIRLAEVHPYESVGLNLRNAVADKAKVWTNAIVPYTIDSTFFTKAQLTTIKEAMGEIQEKTCVQFIPRTNEMPYLFITDLSKCWSEIGMPPPEGIRTLSLDGTACIEQRGTVIHELLHILGFWHEQNRPDRDAYVTINWENIAEGMEHNFVKYSANKMDTLDEPYDYDSIMHYASFAFTKVDKKTIEPRIPVIIGQRSALSPLDVRKINKLYKCPSSSSTKLVQADASAWIHEDAAPSSSSSSSSSNAKPQRPFGQENVPQETTSHLITFLPITELVPLPFRFNWSDPLPTNAQNPQIMFPKDK